MMKTLLTIFGLLSIIQYCFTAIPSDLELCEVGNVECISRVITELMNKSPNGRNDMNIPNLEPLKVNSLKASQNDGGAVNLDLVFKDLEIFGLSKLKVDRAVGFTSDPTTSKFEIYATIPQLHLKGKYKATGRILILPIEGDGPCDIIIDQAKVSIKLKPSVTTKNGKTYIGVDKFKLLLEPGKLTIRLDNLFNGDRTLGENMNKFLNENSKDVWIELGPGINDGISDLIRNLVSNVLKVLPYEDFYKKN